MSTREVRTTIDLDDEWLRIDAIGFFGRWTRSPNERWLLTYGRIHDTDAPERSSDDPTGAVVLFDRGKEVARLEGLTRPETVAVCDAGTFAVYEWGKAGDFLGPLCQLRIFNCQGERLFKLRPGAAVELPALSSDGRFLAFHTLGAPQESSRREDGESVFLIDLTGPAFVWQKPVPVVWPEHISFAPDASELHVHGEDAVFRYDIAGRLLNPEDVEKARLKAALADKWGYSLWDLAHERYAQIATGERPTEQREEVLAFMRVAITKDVSPNTKASIHRFLGEVAEEEGDVTGAVAEYRAAIGYNSKVGVKRKLAQLEARP